MWFFFYFWTFPNDTFSFNLNQGLNHSNSSMSVFCFCPKIGKNHVCLLKISILHHQHHGFPIEIWWMCCATCHLGTLLYLQQKFLICTWKKLSLEFWNLAFEIGTDLTSASHFGSAALVIHASFIFCSLWTALLIPLRAPPVSMVHPKPQKCIKMHHMHPFLPENWLDLWDGLPLWMAGAVSTPPRCHC